jgi:hypothetical protein
MLTTIPESVGHIAGLKYLCVVAGGSVGRWLWRGCALQRTRMPVQVPRYQSAVGRRPGQRRHARRVGDTVRALAGGERAVARVARGC